MSKFDNFLSLKKSLCFLQLSLSTEGEGSLPALLKFCALSLSNRMKREKERKKKFRLLERETENNNFRERNKK